MIRTGTACLRCRLSGTSEELRPEMFALLQSKEPFDPIIRAETAYDFWCIRMGEHLAEDRFAEAFDIALASVLSFEAFDWNDRDSRLHLQDEPLGLYCSAYGVTKLLEFLYVIAREAGIVESPGDHLDALIAKRGPNYMAAERLVEVILAAGDTARLREAAALARTLAIAVIRPPMQIAA